MASAGLRDGQGGRADPPALAIEASKAALLQDALSWGGRNCRAASARGSGGALLQRELRVPRAIFQFMGRSEGRAAPRWPSARREAK
eukprot:791526-Pyramimonas_sp.AAC.1